MNVYIPIEIKSRELEGRILLALVAAEKGHSVLVGGKEHTLAGALNGTLQPGILHHKSIVSGQSEELDRLHQNGHHITCQDEEHGLLGETYDAFARIRFSHETLDHTMTLFAWGQHDANALTRLFPEFADKFQTTGSPRVDLWRTEFSHFYTDENIEARRPFILFPSNIGTLLNENRLWDLLDNNRRWIADWPENLEQQFYNRLSRQALMLWQWVYLLRRLSDRYPNVRLIVRPHPTESLEAWRALLGPGCAAEVIRDGPISVWVKNASVVLHDGCTTGFEAAVSGVPVVAFEPLPSESARAMSNAVSWSGRTSEDVIERIGLILEQSSDGIRQSSTLDSKILRERFANIEGPLAADRIVEHWETLAHGELGRSNDWDRLEGRSPPETRQTRHQPRIRGSAIGLRDRFRSAWASFLAPYSEPRAEDAGIAESPPTGFRTAHKFPPVTTAEIDDLVQRFRNTLGRFDRVEYRRIGPKTFVFEPKSQATRAR